MTGVPPPRGSGQPSHFTPGLRPGLTPVSPLRGSISRRFLRPSFEAGVPSHLGYVGRRTGWVYPAALLRVTPLPNAKQGMHFACTSVEIRCPAQASLT
jgi:hypothetical protein